MAREILYKHYQRTLAKWPVDLLRPEVSFQTVMRRRIDKRFLPHASQPMIGAGINGTSVAPAQGQHFEEKAEFEQVNVLYSLLENRYLDEASLKSDVLPGSVERATRSTATILVWEDDK
ncbi:hypothetical protein MMC31_002770 [Peltigera leucophlebia]|nr:hypothetical protein [Peltigera leucophlebia]